VVTTYRRADVVVATLPDPATLGAKMHGRTCAGTWVTGTGVAGNAREVYLYHVTENDESMAIHGAQAVVWQTAINPVVALELVAEGVGVARACSARRHSTRCRSSTACDDRGEDWRIDERIPSAKVNR
jgi:hypothetical protein